MKIVIGGAGAVGTHLAALLAAENHDIVLMDEDPGKLSLVGDADYMTLEAPPTQLGGLKSAGVASADLFVAVTPYETDNITCCMLAHAMGAKKTVARVDNSEYMKEEYHPLFQKMGIHKLIYPEMLAAHDIVEGIRYSWIRQFWDVHNGALMLLGIKLRENTQILGIPLKELMRKQAEADETTNGAQRYHIVAIKRGDETLMPNGNTELRLGDIAYFMTTAEHMPFIREKVGKTDYTDVNSVFVMGGSKAAVHAINSLPRYMRAIVFDIDKQRCNRLTQLITNRNCLVVHGDATDAQLLKSEGIDKVQAFAALTNHPEQNILACLAAKRMGVRKTVAMIENLEFAQLAEKLDIGTIINKKTIAASSIYRELLQADVRDIKCLSILGVDVAEFKVPEDARIASKKVMELHLPPEVVLGGLVRDGKGILIEGKTEIMPGDSVLVFCKAQMMAKMDEFFK
ncbi:MAG: Trk system potassium transporter TrkA [Bacteroidaceae bacterium]|nr:Trk system potassium transporter TrkA [Bacteroidaceae bacterium]